MAQYERAYLYEIPSSDIERLADLIASGEMENALRFLDELSEHQVFHPQTIIAVANARRVG